MITGVWYIHTSILDIVLDFILRVSALTLNRLMSSQLTCLD